MDRQARIDRSRIEDEVRQAKEEVKRAAEKRRQSARLEADAGGNMTGEATEDAT